MINIT